MGRVVIVASTMRTAQILNGAFILREIILGDKEGMKMAELLECLLCGYKTVRCGMSNHIKSKHPDHYETNCIVTKSLGQIKCKDLKTFIKTLNERKA